MFETSDTQEFENATQELVVVDSAPSQALALPIVGGKFKPSIDQQVQAWLHAKHQRSMSPHTLKRYQRHVSDFREVLAQAGCDLDSDPSLIATLAQGWASKPMLDDSPDAKPAASTVARHRRMEDGQGVSAATFNARVVSLSSFYEYAIKRAWFQINPMKMVETRRVTRRDYARPFTIERYNLLLARIDRSTLIGKRDYAMLLTWVMTGRRISEIWKMRWGDITIDDQTGAALVRFPECKGGKEMEDILQPDTKAALFDYLRALHGAALESLPSDTGLWVTLTNNAEDAHSPLQCAASLRHICLQRLGTGKTHAIRHTFAVAMERSGAKLSDIGHRLGHSNLQTTSVYMERFHGAENEFAPMLEAAFTSSHTNTEPVTIANETGRVLSKRERTIQAIDAHPELSNAALAKMLGVDESTVARRRQRMGANRPMGTNQYKIRDA